jgi:hypothetical protein
MTSRNFRYIQDFQAKIARPFRKIHVLKPERTKLCVKSPQPMPHFAPEHEKRAGRLVAFGGLGKVDIQAPVTPVQRVGGEQVINAEHLECQRPGSGESPQRESSLNVAGLVNQFS